MVTFTGNYRNLISSYLPDLKGHTTKGRGLKILMVYSHLADLTQGPGTIGLL